MDKTKVHVTTGKCWCGYINGRMAAWAAKSAEPKVTSERKGLFR